MRPLALIIVTLAAYRATRLIVADTLLGSWRARWFLRYPPNRLPDGTPAHPLGQLVDCPWCAGWWAAGLAVTLAASMHVLPWRPSTWVFAWPAAATGVGLLGGVDR